MLLPLLIPASTSPPALSAVPVVVDSHDGFQLVFDALAEVLVPEQPQPADVLMAISDLLDVTLPDVAVPGTGDDVAGEDMKRDAADSGNAVPVNGLVDVSQNAPTTSRTYDDARLPTLMQRLVVQMMSDRTVVPDARQVEVAKGLQMIALDQDVAPSAIVQAKVPGRSAPGAVAIAGPQPDAAKVAGSMMRMPELVTSSPTSLDVPEQRDSVAPPPAFPRDPPAQTIPAAGMAMREVALQVAKPVISKTGLGAATDTFELAFDPTVDSAPVTGSAKASDLPTAPAVARQVAQQMAVAVTQTTGMPTEIALNPEELGRVRMSMSTNDGALMLHIVAERPETVELLRRHIDTLAQEFRSLGYSDISFDFGDDRAADPKEHKTTPTPDHADDDTGELETEPQRTVRVVVGLDLRL